MTISFSSIDLANEISSIRGEPSYERSIEILRLLLDNSREINATAPIANLLYRDINESIPNRTIGHAIGIKLATGNSNDALVRYLLVPLGGRSGRGRSLEFASRQFWYAVTNGLRSALALRAINNNTIYAVAEGLFYSEARGNSDLGSARRRIAASFVSSDLIKFGLTSIAKSNLNYVHRLIHTKDINDNAEYEKIIYEFMENLKSNN